MIRLSLLLGGFFLTCSVLWGQKVTVSEDINLRTDYVYDILGKVDDKILLYRDKGFNHVLQVFDENLWEMNFVRPLVFIF